MNRRNASIILQNQTASP